MTAGYLVAASVTAWGAVACLAGLEALCLFWMRESLAQNLIKMIRPSDAIRAWQTR
jgi:hypothetical protein